MFASRRSDRNEGHDFATCMPCGLLPLSWRLDVPIGVRLVHGCRSSRQLGRQSAAPPPHLEAVPSSPWLPRQSPEAAQPPGDRRALVARVLVSVAVSFSRLASGAGAALSFTAALSTVVFSMAIRLVCDMVEAACERCLDAAPNIFAMSGFNGRPHRLVPRRGELDCRMLLFTSELDPTIIANAAQHQFTRWNRKASGDFPIVEA